MMGLNLMLSVAQNRRREGRMQETKETGSDWTTTVQERMHWRQHQQKQHTWCTALGESVLWSMVLDFSRCKQNKGV